MSNDHQTSDSAQTPQTVAVAPDALPEALRAVCPESDLPWAAALVSGGVDPALLAKHLHILKRAFDAREESMFSQSRTFNWFDYDTDCDFNRAVDFLLHKDKALGEAGRWLRYGVQCARGMVDELMEYYNVKSLKEGARDLSHARIGCSDFPGANFAGVDFSHTNLAFCDFSGANLEGCLFVGAELEDVKFVGANLKGANFTDAHIPCDFTGADLTDANFTGVSGTRSNLFKGVDLANVKRDAPDDADAD